MNNDVNKVLGYSVKDKERLKALGLFSSIDNKGEFYKCKDVINFFTDLISEKYIESLTSQLERVKRDAAQQLEKAEEVIESYSNFEDGKYYGPSDIYEDISETALEYFKNKEDK